MAVAARTPASPETQEQRAAFGRAIDFWMRKNGFSQQSPHDWAKANEWVMTGDDFLWRRTRLGLVMSKAEAVAIDCYIQAQDKI